MTLGFHVPTALPGAWPVGVYSQGADTSDSTFQMLPKPPLLSTPMQQPFPPVSTSSFPSPILPPLSHQHYLNIV